MMVTILTGTLFTVKDLRLALDAAPDDMWVVVEGRGPIKRVWAETGANEPFVVLEASPIFSNDCTARETS